MTVATGPVRGLLADTGATGGSAAVQRAVDVAALVESTRSFSPAPTGTYWAARPKESLTIRDAASARITELDPIPTAAPMEIAQ